jgi:hypothetical protein
MVTLPCGTFQTALINSLHAMHLPVHYLHFFISSTENKSSAPSGILHMHEKHLFSKITSVCKQFVFALLFPSDNGQWALRMHGHA